MSSPIVVDPAVFLDGAIAEETRRLNADIEARLSALPDQWSFEPAMVRERRRQGLGPFPLAPKSPRAETIEIAGAGGVIPLRIIAPQRPAGVFLHIHGGGWVLGGADEQDPRLERLVGNTGFAVVSVEYRLSPEHPYPAAPDDCEAAALWLAENAAGRFGTTRLAIGGESAGAHLAVVTLLRLRDRHGMMPFSGAVLLAGCYDLAMTPSAANWGMRKLVLNSRDICKFVECFLGDTAAAIDPDVSPLRAALHGLPPALFVVGTNDPLLDDSMFMSMRWGAAGADARLSLWPGGCHVFQAFPSTMTDASLDEIEGYLSALA
ncbi:MAG: alpha/beta hydrolase [Hyphomicrobiales bacterium]